MSVPLPHVLGLPFELLVHLLLFLVVPGLAAGLQVDLVDAPEVQLLAEGEGAHLLHHVQLSCAVEVQDGGEGAGVSVEKVLVVIQAVVVTYLHDGVVGVAVPQLAQSCAGQPVQRPPQDFMEEAPDVQSHSAGVGLAADYVHRIRRQRGARPSPRFYHLRSSHSVTWKDWKIQPGRLRRHGPSVDCIRVLPGVLLWLQEKEKKQKYLGAVKHPVPVSYSSNVRWFIHSSENQIDILISFKRHSRFSC